MRRTALFCWLLLVVALLPALVQAHAPAQPSGQIDVLPGSLRIVRAARGTQLLRIPAPARPGRIGVQSATFNVTYNGFSNEAKQAFQRAVDIWSGLITSPVPINVVAYWEPLDPNVLGAAGPTTVRRNFTNAPVQGTWYPAALANALAGTDLDATPEIEARFSSVYNNWYLGTDGNTPLQQYDLVTVVLHELGHGLGFYATMGNNVNANGWGIQAAPIIFDRFIVNGANQHLIDTSLFPNPSSALGAQLVSNNIFFDGTNAVAAANGSKPKLYAPSTWNGGSSISHLDTPTYAGTPNALMRHELANGASIHNPGPITLGIFKDLGWPIPTSDTPIAGLTASQRRHECDLYLELRRRHDWQRGHSRAHLPERRQLHRDRHGHQQQRAGNRHNRRDRGRCSDHRPAGRREWPNQSRQHHHAHGDDQRRHECDLRLELRRRHDRQRGHCGAYLPERRQLHRDRHGHQ
jgi:hypothetical protein